MFAMVEARRRVCQMALGVRFLIKVMVEVVASLTAARTEKGRRRRVPQEQ